ncbi:MAG: histidine phosphatase family protein [Ectothiorhodospiraceae bacterium]
MIAHRATHLFALLIVVCLLLPSSATANTEPQQLVDSLRAGGYVLYFRHAQTDWSQSDRVAGEGSWTSCDPARMRQLSDEGRATARHVGAAIRRLGIPVHRVYASEYCRSLQTAELLDVGPVIATRDILNARAAEFVGGREMLARTARKRLSTPAPSGTNTVLVAHGNVFLLVAGMRPPEAGSVVVKPLGNGEFKIVGVLTADDWSRLGNAHTD